jgi:hypothetical protein
MHDLRERRHRTGGQDFETELISAHASAAAGGTDDAESQYEDSASMRSSGTDYDEEDDPFA